MKKPVLICVLALLTMALLLSTTACSFRGSAPKLETVYDRLVEVIEASHEANVLLFGVGLPVYSRGDAEDELLHRYYGVADNGREYVTPYAKYATMEEMKTVISKVYCTSYRESLFSSLFTGYADSGLSIVMPARYSEDERAIYQNVHVDPLVIGTRVYDYASMKLTKESYDTYLYVEIRSYPENKPNEWTTTHLTFVFEDGNWYLNGPSC